MTLLLLVPSSAGIDVVLTLVDINGLTLIDFLSQEWS